MLSTSAETPRLTRSSYNWQRVLESVPAVLLVGAVLIPPALLFGAPTLAYLLFSGYLIYWMGVSASLAIRQVVEWFTMRRYRLTDWDLRLRRLTDPYDRLHLLADRPRLNADERSELVALRDWVHSGPDVPAPDDVYHLVVMPVSNEDASIITQSIDAIAQADYPADRILVCLTFEARSAVWSPEQIVWLQNRYADTFGMFLTTRHPDGVPGEGRVKGANISWGAREARRELHRRGLRDDQVIVSAFDSDTRASRSYFQVLTYTYLTNPDRDIDSYQPILLFHNNVWDVPAVSRLVGFIASMWTIVDSTRPERMRIFSSHAMGMKALVGVNFWSTNVIPDDSRQFWRMFYATDGRAKTVPLHVPVYLDAVQATGLFSTLREQYRQIRRWSYGVIDFPYIMEQNLANPRVPLGTKVLYTWRQLSQFHFWATVPIMMMVLRPVVGSLEPIVAHSGLYLVELAALANRLSVVATVSGVVMSVGVALSLLPKRPAHRSPLNWVRFTIEWLCMPLMLPIFLCAPAIDSQFRLLARRYLGFRVTVKNRRYAAPQVH